MNSDMWFDWVSGSLVHVMQGGRVVGMLVYRGRAWSLTTNTSVVVEKDFSANDLMIIADKLKELEGV